MGFTKLQSAMKKRFAALGLMIVLGSCDPSPTFQEQEQSQKSTREFYLQCVQQVTQTTYGPRSFDMMEECRKAAQEIK